jgi:hypothetical protein
VKGKSKTSSRQKDKILPDGILAATCLLYVKHTKIETPFICQDSGLLDPV